MLMPNRMEDKPRGMKYTEILMTFHFGSENNTYSFIFFQYFNAFLFIILESIFIARSIMNYYIKILHASTNEIKN